MKQINVRVDEQVYAGIEERAAAAGMAVPEFARQVLADEGNDMRHRFLAAGAHFADSWSAAFEDEFGPLAAADRSDRNDRTDRVA